MKQFIRFTAVAVVFLLVGLSTSNGQEVVFTAGPAVPFLNGGSNGGFAWADVNGDGTLDVFIPPNNVTLNYITSFAAAVSTKTVLLTSNVNSVGGLFADFNGDGVPDLWSTNNANPKGGFYYDNAGTYLPATGTGDLAIAGSPSNVFCGMAVADIDHSNYLSAAWSNWTGSTIAAGDGNIYRSGLGIELLKGGPFGFTNIGKIPGLSANVTKDFQSDTVGYAYPHIGWSAADIQSIDSLDPTGGTNKALKNRVHNYNAAPVLKFVLAPGKWLSDYNSFTFKGYFAQGDVGYKDIVVEAYQTMPTGQAYNVTANKIGSWNRAQNGSTAWENITVDITNTKSFSDTVYIAFGINCAGTGNVGGTGVETIWYADNVTLVANVPTYNVGIDTSRTFESWDVHFLDANNDGYPDLLMPSFRHGYSPFNIQVDSIGARKGSILYMNDGTGKFFVPTGATLARTIYCIDSISAAGVRYTRTVADTGIIVDDTVRHFNAIGSQFGDLNNDGIVDLILTGTETKNYDGFGAAQGIVVVYGKGDGTFTYKWNGTNVVNSGLPTSGSIRAWDIGDYNNDGIPDVYASTTYSTTRLFRGNGNGTYTEVTSQDYVATAGGGRAGGFVDYNNDGFLDIYNYSGQNSVLQKNGGNSNHWIGFTPVGTGHNMSAIGARFLLYTQGGTFKQYRYIKGEGNAAGHGDMRALFGIGINTSIDSVNVLWPDGTSKTYTGLAVDKYWTIKEGSVPPNMPALVYPANAAVAAAKVDTLKWNPGASALKYNVQVSLDPTFAKKLMLAVNATVTDTSYAFSLGAATKYYWRVAAVNGGFTSDYTTANNFTTAGSAAAAVPSVLSPTSGSKNQAALLTLKVGKTSDASRYQWQVSTLPTFVTFFTNDSTADTTYAGQFTGGQTFYLRVRGTNDLGASAFCAVDTFTIMTPPGRTTLVSPANNAQNVITDSVIFAWSKVSTAASYNLQLSTINSTSTYAGITDTTYKVKGLAKLTNYTWKVEAINAGGTSYYTGGFAFTTVMAAPATPLAGVPAQAAVDVNRLTRFTWGPVLNGATYRLQVATDNLFATVLRDTVTIDTTAILENPLASNTDYYWQVRAQNIGGNSAWSTARLFTTGTVLSVPIAAKVPTSFALMQNYPNPFNPSTTISYDIPKSAFVSLKIYDLLGREVTTLVDGIQTANSYKVQWNPAGLSSGVYFYRITARSQDGSGNFTSVKKLLFMK